MRRYINLRTNTNIQFYRMKQNAQKLIELQNMVIKWQVNTRIYKLTTKLSTDSVDKKKFYNLYQKIEKLYDDDFDVMFIMNKLNAT